VIMSGEMFIKHVLLFAFCFFTLLIKRSFILIYLPILTVNGGLCDQLNSFSIVINDFCLNFDEI
jgi:hypothetical protein